MNPEMVGVLLYVVTYVFHFKVQINVFLITFNSFELFPLEKTLVVWKKFNTNTTV
jgi:hypothetical protein